MTFSTSIRPRIEGWILITAIASLLIVIFFPRVNEIVSTQTEITLLTKKAENYTTQLNSPIPPNEYEVFDNFIVNLSSDIDMEVFRGALQSRLLQTVKANKARLIDLRATEADSEIEHLSASQFSLVVEGDLKALFDTLEGLATLSEPFLIPEMSIKAARNQGRPDKNLRLTLTLVVWTQGGKQ